MKGGYLVRSAIMDGDDLTLQGDLNETTSFEIIAPSVLSEKVLFNGRQLEVERTSYGSHRTTTSRQPILPEVSIKTLSFLTWVCLLLSLNVGFTLICIVAECR